MTVDTLSLAKQLRAAEMPPMQADAIAAAIGGAVAEGVATKADMDVLRGELRQVESRLETRIEQLRSNLLTYFIATVLSLAAVIIAVVKL